MNTGLRNMKSFASGIVDDIASFFASLPAKALAVARSLGESFLRGLGAGLAKLGDTLASLILDPLNAVIKAWNGLRIPGFTVTLPKVNTDIPGVGTVGGESRDDR
jgi:hypothetical protein